MEASCILSRYISESGKKKVYLCDKMGISRPRLDYIISKPDTATYQQADVLIKECGITKNDSKLIFLPKE